MKLVVTRKILAVLAFLFLAPGAMARKGMSQQKPNILWIVANDLSSDLGCYGNKLVHTPNLDQLARQGVMYRNFVSTGAVCSPSRSSLITGMYQVSINSQNQFPKDKTTLPAFVLPLPAYFRQAGFFVANTGGVTMNGPHYTGYNFVHEPKKVYDGFNWQERQPGQPFFAQVHLTYAHRPYTQFNAYKKWDYPVLTLMQVLQQRGELTPAQARFMAATRPAEELYDLRNDPYELNNLAGQASYAAKLKELRGQMEAWLARADKGPYPESPAEVSYARELMKNKFKTEMEKKGLHPTISDEDFLRYWEQQLIPTKAE